MLDSQVTFGGLSSFDFKRTIFSFHFFPEWSTLTSSLPSFLSTSILSFKISGGKIVFPICKCLFKDIQFMMECYAAARFGWKCLVLTWFSYYIFLNGCSLPFQVSYCLDSSYEGDEVFKWFTRSLSYTGKWSAFSLISGFGYVFPHLYWSLQHTLFPDYVGGMSYVSFVCSPYGSV